MAAHTVRLPGGACFRADDGEDLLTAAQRAHWLVRYGCRNGNCEACAATLRQGCVEQRGATIDGGETRILLCLCRARSDVLLELPGDPQHGSETQARRCYARLQDCEPRADGGWTLRLIAPAGRQPPLQPGQYLLLEQGSELLRAELETLQGRELTATTSALPAMAVGAYAFIRYPLGFCYPSDSTRPTLILHQPQRRTQAERLARALPGADRIELADADFPNAAIEAHDTLVLACADSTVHARGWYEALLAAGNAFSEFRCDGAIWLRWQVRRQDDNGNRFVVEAGLSEERARQLAGEFEQRGHKQLYWAEPMLAE